MNIHAQGIISEAMQFLKLYKQAENALIRLWNEEKRLTSATANDEKNAVRSSGSSFKPVLLDEPLFSRMRIKRNLSKVLLLQEKMYR